MAGVDIMPLSTSSYIADTGHLSLPHHGAYLLILMTMWRASGWIPDDEHVLANICKVSVKKWRALSPILRPLLLQSDGKLSQKRLLRELERTCMLTAKRSASGVKGGIAKSLKTKKAGLANATALPDDSLGGRQNNASGDYTLSSSPTGSKEEVTKKGSSRGSALPGDWQPSPRHFEHGKKLELTDDEVREFAEDMRLWARANANRSVGRKADWEATFDAWMRRESGRKKDRQLRMGGSDGKARSSGGQGGQGKHRTFASFSLEQAGIAGEKGR